MQRIGGLELRKNLSRVCEQVKGGENIILSIHGVDNVLLTRVAWASFFEKIGQIDGFLQSANLEVQSIFRKIIADALRYYAEILRNTNEPLKLNELLWRIGEDLNIILMGEKKKRELDLN